MIHMIWTFSYVPEYLKSKEHMLQLMKNAYTKGNEENEELFVPIIIGCVDNHNCRKILHEVLKNTLTLFILMQQMNSVLAKLLSELKAIMRYLHQIVPFIFQTYLRIVKSVLEMSCTELNAVNHIHLITNLFCCKYLSCTNNSYIKRRLDMWWNLFF